MSRTFNFVTLLSVVSAAIGIYVFFSDEITARLFPDQKTATKADIKEQFQLSEDRIAEVVAASVADAVGKAQAKGENVSQVEKVDYEAALTKLLSSDDPALNDAKFLAVSGETEAAAENIVTSISASTDAGDTVQAKSRADLLRSAGDILVPSNAQKALAAYEKALEFDPGNQVLQTRVQRLKIATAAKNEVVGIPGAAFELGGLKFEFEGCDQPQAPRCVFNVMNPTPDLIGLSVSSRQWGIDEAGLWVQAGRKAIVASSKEYWEVPSLEASQIEFSFRSAANMYQLLRLNFRVDGVGFDKEFRDIAIRGGKQVQVRSMRPVDPAHPEYAYEIAGVKIHFLGCTSPDAPVCQFDMMNTGNKDVTVDGRGAVGYTSQGIQLEAVKSEISLENKKESSAPPGIAFTWEVTFNREAALFQSFWPELRINYDAYPREFRDVLIGDTSPPVKVPRLDEAVSPDAIFEMAGLKFVFLGCRNTLNPTCTFDVQNFTDKALLIDMRNPVATLADGTSYKANSDELEMSRASAVKFPAGVTTTYNIAFRHEMSEITNLSLKFYVDRNLNEYSLTNINVE